MPIDTPRRVRVAIVDDDARLRDALATLLNQEASLTCVGRFSSIGEALPRLAALEADVLLLDVHLRKESGAEGVRRIVAAHPSLAVLMLTAFPDEARVFESICNGAVGYLLKTITPERLVTAIHDAAAGGSPMSPEVARKVVALFQRTGGQPAAPTALTPQETRLLSLLARGFTYEAAGLGIGVTVNTVRNYVRSIYEKLHVHSKSEAVAKAFRQGLI